MRRITFLHPDLGIGGAERLIVDAALGLKRHGHSVNIVTTHHDESHAFEETLNGEIPVTVVGDWIPRSIFKRFYALMAYFRMIYAAFYIIFFSDLSPEIIFCDLVSVAIPILKFKVQNVIFYCHYPDQLLSERGGILKDMYRAPLNWLEEVSMGKATQIFVNSNFTAGVFKNTFKRLTVTPDVLYPTLNMDFFDSFLTNSIPAAIKNIVGEDSICFLSINRYERKKNLRLALEAFGELKEMVDAKSWDKMHLIMAGGYDSRVLENIDHFQELTKIKLDLNLDGKVTLLKSPNDKEKISLIKMCVCLIYTPSNEHFGIVPIEAMYLGKPVIAVNSGGPTETVLHGETGYLCPALSLEFASAMSKFICDKSLSEKLGAAGRRRVSHLFSFERFAAKLDQTVNDLLRKKQK